MFSRFFHGLRYSCGLEFSPVSIKDGNVTARRALYLFARGLVPYVWAEKFHAINIMDYSSGDPAETKVKCAERAFIPRISSIDHVVVKNFNTNEVGFNALCLLKQPRTHFPRNTVGLVNVAPIYRAEQVGNGEHDFLALLLDNGVVVFAPNAGQNIWHLLPYTVAILKLDFENEVFPHLQGHEGQFRSWWHFSQAIKRLLEGDFSKVVSAWRRNKATGKFEGGPEEFRAPEAPATEVGALDNYGNVRTSVTDHEARKRGWRPGDELQILVDGKRVASGIYKPVGPQPEGTICIRPGSNIIQLVSGGFLEFLDGFVIYGSAHQAIGEVDLGKHVVTFVKV